MAGHQGQGGVLDSVCNDQPGGYPELQCILPHIERDNGLQPNRHVASLRAAIRVHRDHGVRGLQVSSCLSKVALSSLLTTAQTF